MWVSVSVSASVLIVLWYPPHSEILFKFFSLLLKSAALRWKPALGHAAFWTVISHSQLPSQPVEKKFFFSAFDVAMSAKFGPTHPTPLSATHKRVHVKHVKCSHAKGEGCCFRMRIRFSISSLLHFFPPAFSVQKWEKEKHQSSFHFSPCLFT